MATDVPRLDYTCDIETEGWESFVLGALFDGVKYEEFDWRREREFAERLFGLPPGSQVWAWNGGRFDWIWALDWAIRLGYRVDIVFAGSGMSTLTVKNGPILRDGVKLYPAKLQKAALLCERTMSKDTGLPCVCEEDCGGYCSIKRDMPADQLSRLGDYLEEDVRVLHEVMDTILTTLDREGFDIRGTIGGTAWATARSLCNAENADWPSAALYKRVRRGYYGGRTQVFRPAADSGHRYDIHSAYPAALDRLELPVGPAFCCDSERASGGFANDRQGIYEASVYVPPDTFIPPLPARTGERLAYPVGMVHGAWTGLELRYAMSCGARLERIHSGTVWVESEPILRPYQRKVWSLRSSASGEWRKFWKWYANALTGKLAQQPEHESYVIHPEPGDIRRCPADYDCKGWCKSNRCCAHKCSGRCGAWLMKDGRGRVWAKKSWRIASSGHVHWAAHLTASARIQLHSQLVAHDDGHDAIYCDTDSVYAINERTENIGDDLGQWGYDGPLFDWHSIAPKSYAYHDGKQWNVRAKGMPEIRPEQLVRMANGENVEIVANRGIASVKSGLIAARKDGGKIMRRKNLTRTNHADFQHYGDRLLADDGKTYPRQLKDLLK